MTYKIVAAAAVAVVASANIAAAADNQPTPPKTCPEGQQLVHGVCKKVKDHDFCPPEGCLVKPEGFLLRQRKSN